MPYVDQGSTLHRHAPGLFQPMTVCVRDTEPRASVNAAVRIRGSAWQVSPFASHHFLPPSRNPLSQCHCQFTAPASRHPQPPTYSCHPDKVPADSALDPGHSSIDSKQVFYLMRAPAVAVAPLASSFCFDLAALRNHPLSRQSQQQQICRLMRKLPTGAGTCNQCLRPSHIRRCRSACKGLPALLHG